MRTLTSSKKDSDKEKQTTTPLRVAKWRSAFPLSYSAFSHRKDEMGLLIKSTSLGSSSRISWKEPSIRYKKALSEQLWIGYVSIRTKISQVEIGT
jgi:hypothetical protein